MKVKELMRVTHLVDGQHTTVHDVETKETFRTYNRYDFNSQYGRPAEYILDMKVNTFRVSDSGIEIYAQASKRKGGTL